GLAFTFIGRKDLPGASKYVGHQLGRVVGMLQGARLRIDQFSSSTGELQKLQSELRMGLRELDAVRAEMAMAASSTGLVGRNIMRGGMDRRGAITEMHIPAKSRSVMPTDDTGMTQGDSNSSALPMDSSATTVNNMGSSAHIAHPTTASTDMYDDDGAMDLPQLASRDHAVHAVAEEEWVKRGIGFKSRAEMGTFGSWRGGEAISAAMKGQGISAGDASSSSSWSSVQVQGGASILSDVIQEGLIYDQYERSMREQEDLLQSRVAEKIRNQRRKTSLEKRKSVEDDGDDAHDDGTQENHEAVGSHSNNKGSNK
ncbi:MAG: hypothetical protein ACRDL7_14275, partial [Gaiellaceae bacterium]